uniref:Endo/exonuclease/phosphatase domain-containing protein n=1 Tax=Parastrongyloides trichosuri TaxID=131310 RepID=A0A0N4ZZQ9_PARTI
MITSDTKRTSHLMIGSINLRHLSNYGKLENVISEMEKENLDVLILVDTKWKKEVRMQYDEVHVLIGNGKPAKNKGICAGVGAIVKKNVNILNMEIVNERITHISIKTGRYVQNIIGIYAPTEDYPENDIDLFYEELGKVLKRSMKMETKNGKRILKNYPVIIGDWNARVGTVKIKGIHGGHYLHKEISNNGQRLLDFSMEHRLSILNTFYKRKEIRGIRG